MSTFGERTKNELTLPVPKQSPKPKILDMLFPEAKEPPMLAHPPLTPKPKPKKTEAKSSPRTPKPKSKLKFPELKVDTIQKSKPAPAKKEKPATPTNPKKDFLKAFHKLTFRHSAWEVWNDFVTMYACSISNAVDKTNYDEREARYMSIIEKYSQEEQSMFPELAVYTMLALADNPEQDFFGDIYGLELNLCNRKMGQVLTPYHISHFMASITLDNLEPEIEEKGYATIHDPCCGGGVMLIAAINISRNALAKANLNSQNHALITGQDIDPTMAMMCYIQISLLGAAGYVKVGNSLSEPMCSTDTTENYWFTPMYFSDVWHTRRLVKKMSSLIKDGKEIEGEEKITSPTNLKGENI